MNKRDAIQMIEDDFNIDALTYDISDFEADQNAFNIIAGTADNTSFNDILNQFNLIAEEVQEIAEGLRNNDPVEVLDGAIDTLFTTLGLIQKLNRMGMRTHEAMHRVAKDNLSKFPKDIYEVEDSIEEYATKGVILEYEFNEPYQCYVMKDENHKVRKSIKFTPTDLTEFVPVKLRSGFKK